MAVRRLPQGVSVDLGFDRKSGMDRLNELLNNISNVAGRVQSIRDNRESNNVQALQAITDLIDNATSGSDIEQTQNIYNQNFDDTHFSDNPAYNTLIDVANMKMENRSTKITDFERDSQEFANALYSTDNIFETNALNLGAEQLEKLFIDKNLDEIGGWLDGAIKYRDEIAVYGNNLTDLYGEKNPNFKINVNGELRSISQVRFDLERFDQLIDGLHMKALDDGVLSPQEAQELAKIRPSQGYNSSQFKTFIDGKRAEAGTLYEEGQKLIYNDSLKLIGKIIAQQNKGGGVDVARATAAITGVFGDEKVSSDAAASIPLMDTVQYEDESGSIVSLGPITGIMSEQEKIENFTKRLQAGQIDAGTLDIFLETLLSEGGRKVKKASAMFNAFGGRKDVFGLEETAPKSSEWWLNQQLGNYKDYGTEVSEELPPPDYGNEVSEEKDYGSGVSEELDEIVNMDIGGNIPAIANVMKRGENIEEAAKDPEKNPTAYALASINNLYAIKYTGEDGRAAKYGAVDSGVQASDGATWAQWPDRESMEKGSKKVIEEMLLDDAKGDVATFVKNYIGKKDINDPEVQSRVAEIHNIPTGEQEKVTITDKAPLKYDNLNKSEKSKLKQLKNQEAKGNPYLYRMTDKQFFEMITREDFMPELKGLDKFIKFITTPPKDFVADISYEELSPTNKKRIEQYKNIKAKSNRYLHRATNEQFYRGLSKEELDKILKI